MNHTNHNNSREQLEPADTQVYDSRDPYNEYKDEHYCLLHHYPNCHYHQIIRKKNTCDNHDTTYFRNSDAECNETLQEPSASYEATEDQIHPNTDDLIYSSNATAGTNKVKATKVKTGKVRKSPSSNPGENIREVNNEMCAHCHCPITSAYTRQIMSIGGRLESKEATQIFGQSSYAVDDSDYRGRILYLHGDE